MTLYRGLEFSLFSFKNNRTKLNETIDYQFKTNTIINCFLNQKIVNLK